MNERKPHPYVPEREPELRMTWRVSSPPPVPRLPAGYLLRQLQSDERQAYADLHRLAWPPERLRPAIFDYPLPGGFFVIEHQASGLLVSSCLALKPGVFEEYPEVGTLGYLVTDPAHGRLGLATAVVLAVMNRLAAEGYPESYLGTEDERLAAINLYLRLGWKPLLYTGGMEERWQAIQAALKDAGLGRAGPF